MVLPLCDVAMTLTTRLAEIRERTEKAANWRSDDFGHDTQELLLAESRYLQVAADDIARLLKVVETLDGALNRIEYDCESYSNPDEREELILRNMASAEAARSEAARILGDG